MTLSNLKLFASTDYPCFVIVPIYFCGCCISAAKLCPTLWKPMDFSFQGSSVLHYRLDLAQIHVQWVSDAKYLLLLLPSIFPSIRVFSSESTLCIRWPNNWALASILVKKIQGWFPLGLTNLILFLSKELSRVFSKTTILKHQIFGAQPSLQSNSYIHKWLLKKT